MKYFGWVFLFFITVYVLPVASRPMVAPQEFQTAEIAREMVERGIWHNPRRLEKDSQVDSIATYAPVAVSIKLFGKNTFAVRFPMLLAVGLTALFIWVLTRQVTRDDKLAALASVIFLSFSGSYLAATTAVADAIFAMLAVGGCGIGFEALQEQKYNRRLVLLIIIFSLFTALGFIVRGGASLAIPVLVFGGYLIWRRDWQRALKIVLPCVLLSLGLILLWSWKQWTTDPVYWRHFITRIAWCVFTGSGLDELPWYTYILVMVLGALPGAVLLIPALFSGKDAWRRMLKQPLYIFACCFLFLPLLFFTFFGGRQPGIILCCFAPLAVLIATGLREYFNSGGHHRAYNWGMTAWGALLTLTGIFLGIAAMMPGSFAGRVMEQLPVSSNTNPLMAVVCLTSGALMFYSLRGNWRGRMYLFFISIALLPVFGSWCVADNAAMPQRPLKKLQRELDFGGKQTVIYAVPQLYDAAAWLCDREKLEVMEKSSLPAIAADINCPERKHEVVVITRSERDARMVAELEKMCRRPHSIRKIDGVSATLFPGK